MINLNVIRYKSNRGAATSVVETQFLPPKFHQVDFSCSETPNPPE